MATHCELARIALDELGAVRIAGADALPFLQGQLSNDVTRLGPEQALLAGYHNPQGRVIALLRLVWLADGEVLAVLPRELAGPVAQRLARYVLRAKATVSDVSQAWSIGGLAEPGALEPADSVILPRAELPDGPAGAQRRLGERLVLTANGPGGRWLEIAPRTTQAAHPAPPCEAWRLLEVRAGTPQVYAVTSAQFVAQMLNLDVLGAIAFDKGCYTGQEVIARAHYRGRVKRRAQRFCTAGAVALAPGALGRLPDRRAFTVVEAARRPDGRCEFLAVTSLPGEPLGAEAEAGGAIVPAEPLELPYALPA